MKTKSMPFGNVEEPINPITLALAAGATFVARGFSGEPKHLVALMKEGLEHKGFAFIDVFSPCVTYNHNNTYPWFKERVTKLEDDPSYDPSDWHVAMTRALLWGDEIPIGKFFVRTDLPSLDQSEPVLDQGEPLTHRQLRISAEVARDFIAELM
jgi:2-oxoglutarate/2-oxoacid ferredoxin oxidoreductase subunit beta